MCSALLAALVLAAVTVTAHHEILAKFDDHTPVTLTGVVTLVDWRNPHVHVFMDVRDKNKMLNWAVELESPIDLQRSGWTKDSLRPGDSITVEGMAARNGSRQAWGKSVALAGSGRHVLNVTATAPPPPLSPRPTPRWPDRQPRLGAPGAGGAQGYWAYPSATTLVENGVNVAMSTYGLLQNIADAPKVAPLQPWARALYVERQRCLRDDRCPEHRAPGPRSSSLPYGVSSWKTRSICGFCVLIRTATATTGSSRWMAGVAVRWRRRRQPALLRPFSGQVGGRHAVGGYDRLQRGFLVYQRRSPAYRSASAGRTLLAH
jgi:hypothetical protein